jgi:hypothetical protein
LCALAPALVPLAFAAPASAADTTPPALVSLAATPATVDAPATVVVTAHLAGAATATVRLPGGAPVALGLVSGDTWTAAVAVPAGTAFGAVPLALDLRDAAGNAAAPTVPGALSVNDSRPAAPTSVTVAAEAGTLHVAWAAPAPHGGSDVLGYDVTATPVDAPDAPVPAPAAAPADARAADLPGAAGGVRYAVAVTARNAAGTGPAAVADAAPPGVTTSPAAPAAVTAEPLSTAVEVHWAPPPSDGGAAVTGYTVRAVSPALGGPEPVTVDAAATAAVVPGLLDGVPYDVTVTARNDLGTGPAAAAAVTPRAVPGAPAVTGVTAGDRTARVAWTAPAADGGAAIHAYVVTEARTARTFVLPGTARSATIGGLANGVPASFTVTAVNAAGPGPASLAGKTVVPRRPVRIVVVTQPAAIVPYGTAVGVRAAVRTATGTGVPTVRVDLLAQIRPSTAWTRVASGSTGSAGEVVLKAVLPANAALRLRHVPDAFLASDVAPRNVGVAPRLDRSAPRIRLGQTLAVTGHVAPAHPAGSVVRLQRWTATGWTNVAAGTMTTTTTYRVAWRPGSTGAWTMRVVKPADADHVQGASPTWRQYVDPESVADLARIVRANTRITLDTRHVSGVVDAATARANVDELAAGQLARRSSYGTAPGGATAVDIRLMRALRRMGEVGRVTVTEIAGGSHASGSLHYSGRALDVREVNGTAIRRGVSYGWVVDACRAFGASRVFHPGYDPYGGHQNHVHCDW